MYGDRQIPTQKMFTLPQSSFKATNNEMVRSEKECNQSGETKHSNNCMSRISAGALPDLMETFTSPHGKHV